MAYSKSELEQRLVEIKAQKEMHLANAHATDGAIQILEEIIASFVDEQPSTEPTTKKGRKHGNDNPSSIS